MEASTFDPVDFADELASASSNHRVGTKVLFENDRIRVWDLTLEPGERAPFHAHATDYFFACVEGGRVLTRFPSGHAIEMDQSDGDVVFLEAGSEAEVHDLENVGETRVRYVTVELLAD